MADGLGLGGLLGQQDRVDVGQHAAPGDGDAGQQLAELLVVSDDHLEVLRDDPGLLVVPGVATAGQGSRPSGPQETWGVWVQVR